MDAIHTVIEKKLERGSNLHENFQGNPEIGTIEFLKVFETPSEINHYKDHLRFINDKRTKNPITQIPFKSWKFRIFDCGFLIKRKNQKWRNGVNKKIISPKKLFLILTISHFSLI